MTLPPDNSPIEAAIKAVGSPRELATRLGVTMQAVWLWRRGATISAERAVAIEAATEGRVSRTILRPDLWPVTGGAA